MKKSIILLITLLFIALISTLILKNLSDSEEFIKETNFDYSSTQAVIIIKNLKTEVKKALDKHADDNKEDIVEKIDELAGIPLPFDFGEFTPTITLENIDTNSTHFNLVGIINDGHNNRRLREEFVNNNIDNYYKFEKLIKENISDSNISNHKQLDSIIDTFIRDTRSDKINLIKEKFVLLPKDWASSKNVIDCKISLDVDNLKIRSRFFYSLDKKKDTNFEFYFK